MSRHTRQYRRAMRRQRRFGHEPMMPLVMIAPDEGFGFHVMAAFFRGTWRHRSAMAPFGIAVLIGFTASLLHGAYPFLWPLLAAGTVVAVALVLLAPASWARWWAPLGRGLERAYAASALGYGGLWLTAAVALGPGASLLPMLWMIGIVLCGIPWWAHHRRRRRIQMENTLAAWPDIAQASGIPGTRILTVFINQWGWSARLALPRGITVSHLRRAREAIESSLGTSPGAVRIEPDRTQSNRATIRVMEKDPHSAPVLFPETGRLTINKPIPIGVFESGEIVAVDFLGAHTLIGGMTGSGKSGVVNSILTGFTRCDDVDLVGVDMKEGLELAPWEQCFGRPIATTHDQVEALLADALEELRRRAREMRARGERKWVASPSRPALAIVIDEYAELNDAERAIVDSIARLGRAMAVFLLLSTQRPTQETMGSGAVRSQASIRIALQVKEKRQGDLILDAGSVAAGWRPDLLDAPGKFLISTPAHTQPIRARAYYRDDDAVAAESRANRHHRPPPTTQPPKSGSGERSRVKTLEPTPMHPDRTENAAEAPEGAEEILWWLLTHAPPGGIGISAILDETGRSRQWAQKHLQRLAQEGKAQSIRWGHWIAIEPPAPDPETD